MDQELQNLSIREEDIDFVIPTEKFQTNEINYDLCLLGKLVGERMVNERTLLSLWRPMRGAFIKPLEQNNLYIIQFYHHVDLKKMLAGEPWSLNKCIMLIHQWKKGENLADIEFMHLDVWVQFHGLPLGFASEMLTRNVGNLMGIFLEYDSTQHHSSWINYMRVRIRINVTEPLTRQKSIRKQGGEPIMILFSYERLPLISYVCGIIGHSETHCYKLVERPEEDIVREWPEDIQVKVQARNARRTVQWKRDPSNVFGADYAMQDQGLKFAQSPANHSQKIGNNFSFISKKSMFKSSSDLGVQLGHNCSIGGGGSTRKSPIIIFEQHEKEANVMNIEEKKK